MSLRPIDYSKWDHVDDEESDSGDREDDDYEDEEGCDDEEGQHVPQTLHSGDEKVKPTVTRLDQATPVTIGPNGLEIKHVPRATASPFLAAPPTVSPGGAPSTPAGGNHGTAQRHSSAVADDDDTDSLEDDIMMGKLSRNGAVVESRNYLWSQTRDDVTVSVILPSMDVKGSHILSFAVVPTHSSKVQEEGACRLSFVVKMGSDEFLPFVLPLRYPVKCSEDAIEGCWQLLTLPILKRRLLVAQFSKEKIGEGMYLWWDRLCAGDAPLDVRSFPDRQAQSGNHEAMQKVWADAHDEFRKRAHERNVMT